MLINFSKSYLTVFIVVLISELVIGAFIHDSFIRPYGGDFLIVIMLYAVIKTFFSFPVRETAFGVLLFACLVEISQYFHLVRLLGLQHSSTAKLMLGTTFSFADLLCYGAGILLVLIAENVSSTFKK